MVALWGWCGALALLALGGAVQGVSHKKDLVNGTCEAGLEKGVSQRTLHKRLWEGVSQKGSRKGVSRF